MFDIDMMRVERDDISEHEVVELSKELQPTWRHTVAGTPEAKARGAHAPRPEVA